MSSITKHILILILGLQAYAGLLYGSNPLLTIEAKPTKFVKQDTGTMLLNIMKSDSVFFKNFIDSAESFEIQIIYTQINRDKKNQPTFSQYTYRLNNKVYFCPASTSKLPVSLLALEKANTLSKKGVSIFTPMVFDSAYLCQERASVDTVAPDSILCIANYIKKIMLVSDNDGYNRLFEFLGQQQLQSRLHELGFNKTSIIQRFNNCNADCNRYTNPLKFISKNGEILYEQPMMVNKEIYQNPLGTILKGKGYMSPEGKIVDQPRDFTFYNNLPLQDLHDMMLRLYFPEAFSKKQRFKLTTGQYAFLYKYMSMLPRESDIPKYQNLLRYSDNHKKYLLFGTDSFKSLTNNNLRSFNIVGQMGGYLTDCAYIVDFENNVEFILAATIYNNQSGIFYVPNYRYKSIGFPFLEKLGQNVYKFELSRKRKFIPQLNALKKCIQDTPLQK